jgi:Flp pilus assembly protein TadB
LNRAYMATLFQTTLGHLLIAGAAALQIMGGLVIRRMLRFDF